MKTRSSQISFSNLLHKLALQKGEEKLRIAFKLSEMVRKLRQEGDKYARSRSTTTS